MPGTTVVQQLNQGFPRLYDVERVLSGGWPFWVPFWPNKKVLKITEEFPELRIHKRIIQSHRKMLLRNKDKIKLIEIFSSVPGTFEVWAYGSRVNGHAHNGSDLDLVIRNLNPEPVSNEILLNLKEKIQESTIPILVELRDWARLPERFQGNISRNHEVLFPPDSFSLNEPDVDFIKQSTRNK